MTTNVLKNGDKFYFYHDPDKIIRTALVNEKTGQVYCKSIFGIKNVILERNIPVVITFVQSQNN